jgi:hypothetical protein
LVDTIDLNDSVIVVDATKESAAWRGLNRNASDFINNSDW